jgi:hypothetical protein
VESAKDDAERHGAEMPAVIRRLCSKPPIIAGEDPSSYAQLMELISAEVEPANVAEWLLTKDIADAEWELMRLNGFKAGMINQRMRWGLQKHIDQITSAKNRPSGQQLLHGLVSGDNNAQQQVEKLFGDHKLILQELAALAFENNIAAQVQTDALARAAANRRTSAYAELERLRAKKPARHLADAPSLQPSERPHPADHSSMATMGAASPKDGVDGNGDGRDSDSGSAATP